jgi:hypothetical protein
MIKYFCDRCADEMDRCVTVTITAERPVLDRNPKVTRTLDICDRCGAEIRTVLEGKISRPEPEPEPMNRDAFNGGFR